MNKIGKIICCAVLCIPMVAAIVVGITSNSGKYGNNKNVSNGADNEFYKIRINDMEGNVIREYEDKDVLKLYSESIEKGIPLDTEIAKLENEVFTSYKVDFVGSTFEDSYVFSMSSENAANCYFTTLDEKNFGLDSGIAMDLLIREEFESANKYSGVLPLYLGYSKDAQIYNNDVYADTYNWSYKKINGEISTRAKSEQSSEHITLTLPQSATDISLDFGQNINPETLNVTVMKGTETIYNGEPGALGTYLNFNADTYLDVKVDAKWQNTESAMFYGDATYSFRLFYDVPSQFVLADKALGAGEFTVLEVVGGNTEEKITAEAEFMSGMMDSFMFNGKQYIYIPIKTDAVPKEYDIIITENAGKSTLKFTVNSSKKFGSTDDILPSPAITELLTTENTKEYNDLLEKYRHEISSQQLWKDTFIYPVADGTSVCDFGYTLKITANEKVSEGIYISAQSGSPVVAANDGIVLFAGATKYSGCTVIIDHGLGVLSYYFNLGTITCNNGEAIAKGDTLGTIGHTGYTPYTDTVLYANTVGGGFVNPQTQIKHGISFPK